MSKGVKLAPDSHHILFLKDPWLPTELRNLKREHLIKKSASYFLNPDERHTKCKVISFANKKVRNQIQYFIMF